MSHAGITPVPQVHNPERTGSQIRTDESTLNTEHNIWDGPGSVNLVVRTTSRRPFHFQGCESLSDSYTDEARIWSNRGRGGGSCPSFWCFVRFGEGIVLVEPVSLCGCGGRRVVDQGG